MGLCPFRKRLYVSAGYHTTYMGPGRQEFEPTKPMRFFESYLQETAAGTCSQLPYLYLDEGVIGSFMSARFLKQGNLPGYLPFMVPSLKGCPCTAVEGACGTGGRAIATAMRSVLSDLADAVFVVGFEMQNTVKSLYGADILAGAGDYHRERKKGGAYFFPGIFAERAHAYYQKYGYEETRRAMAKWYEQAILNARQHPKAQEYHNTAADLFALGMTPPDPEKFIPHFNHYDCSKVSDGASSLVIFSEEGLKKMGIPLTEAIEIVGMGEAEGNITQPPEDPTVLSTTALAVQKALEMAHLRIQDIGLFEFHDCFTMTGLLSLEAVGLVDKGKAPTYVLEGNTSPQGKTPVNLSGGLIGFGHPTGATGVRQLVDLWQHLTGKITHPLPSKKSHALMISMGGNDKTTTCLIVKSNEDK